MDHPNSDRSTELSLRLLSFAYFAMGTGSLAVVGTLPSIAASLDLGRGAVALLVTAFSVTFAIAAPLLQILYGDRPRRTLILVGLGLMAIGAIGSALAPNYSVLLAARIVAGLGAAAVGPVASALGSSLVPPMAQGHALAVVFSGMTIASVAGVPLAAWLGATVGWRPMFALIGIGTAVLALLVARTVRDRSGGRRVRPADLFEALRHPATGFGVAVMVLEMAGMFATYTMIAPMLADRFGAGPAAVSAALSVIGIAGVLGNVAARRIARLWPADRAIAVSLVGLAVVFGLLAVIPGIYLAAVTLLVFWALASDVFMPSQQRRMVELAPEMRGLLLALNSSAIYVGMSLGSFAAGTLHPLYGLGVLPVASVGFFVLALGALALSRRAARRPSATAAVEG